MQKTPGIYTEINTQTQRTGLPNQSHSIVFATGDLDAPPNPEPIYDTASADTVSGSDSNAGRMMAAALSISQGVRVDTVGKSKPSDGSDGSGSPIQCTPSSFNIPVYPVATGVLPVFRYLNVSKNDDPIDWFEFDESKPISPSEQMQNLANYLFTAEDGQSVAFVDVTSFGEPPTLNTSTGLLALPVSGLSGNNVTLAGLSYDLYQTGLGIGGRQFEVIDLVNETTTIKIFPMPDASPEEDGYVVMGGNGTDPLVFISCTKAVIRVDPQ